MLLYKLSLHREKLCVCEGGFWQSGRDGGLEARVASFYCNYHSVY